MLRPRTGFARASTSAPALATACEQMIRRSAKTRRAATSCVRTTHFAVATCGTTTAPCSPSQRVACLIANPIGVARALATASKPPPSTIRVLAARTKVAAPRCVRSRLTAARFHGMRRVWSSPCSIAAVAFNAVHGQQVVALNPAGRRSVPTQPAAKPSAQSNRTAVRKHGIPSASPTPWHAAEEAVVLPQQARASTRN